jgi:transcription elongation GreA/GreB family factor
MKTRDPQLFCRCTALIAIRRFVFKFGRLNLSLKKREIVAELRRSLGEELNALESVANQTRDEVGSSETKSEGKYDTRSTEASYLARGQAWRIAELRQLSAWFGNFSIERSFESAEIGALVEVARGDELSKLLFVAPVGGLKCSIAVDGEQRRVEVISQSSPMGSAMVGLLADDGFEVESPKGPVDWDIIEVW